MSPQHQVLICSLEGVRKDKNQPSCTLRTQQNGPSSSSCAPGNNTAVKLTQVKGAQGVPWVGGCLFSFSFFPFFRVNLKFAKFTIPLLVIS